MDGKRIHYYFLFMVHTSHHMRTPLPWSMRTDSHPQTSLATNCHRALSGSETTPRTHSQIFVCDWLGGSSKAGATISKPWNRAPLEQNVGVQPHKKVPPLWQSRSKRFLIHNLNTFCKASSPCFSILRGRDCDTDGVLGNVFSKFCNHWSCVHY